MELAQIEEMPPIIWQMERIDMEPQVSIKNMVLRKATSSMLPCFPVP